MTQSQEPYTVPAAPEAAPSLAAVERRLKNYSWDREHVRAGPEHPVGSGFIEVYDIAVALVDEVQRLEKELTVTDELLDARMTVVDAIPDCPDHGGQCVPHALEWIKEMRELETPE